MSDSTVRIRTQSELQGLRDWNREVRQAVMALDALTQAQRDHARGGDGTNAAGTGVGAGPQPPGAPQNAGAGGAPSPPSAPNPQPPGATPASSGPSRAERVVGGALGFAGRTAATAIGVGLGSSIPGFILSSAQKYMEVSKVITHLDRKLRSVNESTATWGMSLGYTRLQAGALMEEMTRHTDKPVGMFKELLGFSRDRGVDAQQTMSTFGRMGRLSGRAVTSGQLASFTGRADTQRMGQGRLPEYLQMIESLAELQFSSTGHADMSTLGALGAMPAAVFSPDDPRAQGAAGADFMQRMHGVMTSGGPMSVFMMRAMGYGREDGPGYIDMRKRLEEGVTNPDNIADMFGYMHKRGMGRGARFRALESVAGGRLKAHEIESLVDTIGTEKGLASFMSEFVNGDDAARKSFLSGLSEGDRAAFESAGFLGLGSSPGRVSMGSVAEVQMEGLQVGAGGAAAKSMIELRGAIESLAASFGNVFGSTLGEDVVAIAEKVREGTEYLEQMTSGGGLTALYEIIARSDRIGADEGMKASIDFMRGALGNQEIIAAHPEWYTALGAGQ